MRRRCRCLLILGAVLGLAVAGCGTFGGTTGRLEVVATTTQLGDLVREVGGPDVAVHQILQPNTDPHEYEPRPHDVTATARARIVFESGDRLDAWMGKVVAQSGGRPRVVVLADLNVDRVPGARSGPEASKDDPHWWHDPRNVAAAVPAVRAALTRADPAHGAGYARRAAAYAARVRALDAGLARCFDRVPRDRRRLVTNHDAFDYFARRYGVTVVGAVIPSQTTEAQPSAGALARLSAVVRRERVTAIFPESSINPKLARALARQTGARADLELYGDTLGPAGSPGATYLGMERANADAMLEGFTGRARRCPTPGA
jgi:zinc/manganese transport system substrate-binding protein